LIITAATVGLIAGCSAGSSHGTSPYYQAGEQFGHTRTAVTQLSNFALASNGGTWKSEATTICKQDSAGPASGSTSADQSQWVSGCVGRCPGRRGHTEPK